MKKLLFTIFFLIGVLSIIFIFVFFGKNTNISSSESSSGFQESSKINPPIEEESLSEKETNQQLVRKKIETIKKRLALKGLIIAGDSYYREDKLPLALKKYLEFYKQNPNDDLINKKLADTYFALHKYTSALNYYKKISDPSEEDINNKILALFYSADLGKEKDRISIQYEIQQSPLKPEQEFYYLNSLSCIEDFHSCKLQFAEYFWPTDEEERSISFLPLKEIKKSIETYRNFQIDEVYLKNAYLIGAWYGQKLYPLSILLGEDILQEKKSYKPLLKIVAQSYFEIGEYEKSRKVFGEYYEVDTSDPAVNYLLGVINIKLREYVLSNIYFSKALELGYQPSIDIRRQMIHNFYTLGSEKNMLQAFSSLVENETNIESSDLGLAIYYHILQEKYDSALNWAKKGQELFPEDANFYAYQGWILREQGENTEALEVLKKGELLESKNPFILINIAYTYINQEDEIKAKIYFNKVLQSSPESEFSSQAQKELDLLIQK